MFEICKLSAPNLNSIWDIQNYSEIFGDLMFVNSDKFEVQRLYSMDLFKKNLFKLYFQNFQCTKLIMQGFT